MKDFKIEQLFIPIGVIIATIIVAYIINIFLQRLIKKSSAGINSDPTNYKFVKHIVNAVIYIIGFGLAIYSVPSLKTVASSILAGAGILAVAIGFAAQSAFSNVISGVFIVLFKPFRINDRLALRTYTGIVEDITLRHTVIRDFENKRIIIPNSVISDEIIVNSDFTDQGICKWIDIGISYNSDIDLAKKIIAEEIIKHPLHIDPRTPEQLENNTPEAMVRVIGLADSSVNLRGWAWAVNAADSFVLFCDVLESVKKRFDQEGIEIPYPHRTVYMRNEESTLKED